MRAIIIAAGRAKRMGRLSKNLPKCLLEINGSTILRRQIEILRSCRINDIVVVKGYKKELINYADVRYRINHDYLNNDILNSLFCAEADIQGEVLIVYGDILFEPEIVKRLIASVGDMAIVVDTNWRTRYLNRRAHPIAEAENVVMDSEKRLIEIGKIIKNKKDANGEFIGMMKVNDRGTIILKDSFYRAKKNFNDKSFQCAKTFKQAYLTDMLQELVDQKNEIICVCIEGGWLEMDTPQDYITAQKIFV